MSELLNSPTAAPHQLLVLQEKGTEAERRRLADAIMAGKPVMYRVGTSHGSLYSPATEPIEVFGVSVTNTLMKNVDANGEVVRFDGLKIGGSDEA